MDKKKKSLHTLPTRDSLSTEWYTQTKSKKIEKDISWKWKWKNYIDGVAILIPDKIDFKTKALIRPKKDPDISLLGIYLKKPNILLGRNMCLHMFIAALFTIAKI